ncbi:MAG: PEP-CTERM sorting domain-containing protein [Planctomycetales bacterium]
MKTMVIFKRIQLLSVVAILSFVTNVADATLIGHDSFDYADNANVQGQTGGSGWGTNAWAGSNKVDAFTPGYTYTDTSSNVLTVAGNRTISDNNTEGVNRTLSSSYGSDSTSVWVSALISGAAAGEETNISLSDNFFLGQGTNGTGSTNWTIGDSTGVLDTSSTSSVGNTTFLVALIDFSLGAETAWYWLDPLLSSDPTKSSSEAGSGGTSVADFTFNQALLWFSVKDDGYIDELRIGTTYADVSPHTPPPVPEPVSILLAASGLIGLAGARRRRRQS